MKETLLTAETAWKINIINIAWKRKSEWFGSYPALRKIKNQKWEIEISSFLRNEQSFVIENKIITAEIHFLLEILGEFFVRLLSYVYELSREKDVFYP